MQELKSLAKGDREAGLTLVELIVTISIIGILASIMTLSVSKVGSNANISACKNMYQTYALGYSTYQSDYSGAAPGELSNLARFGYVDPKLQNNSNFSMQNSVYEIKSAYLTGTTLAIQFSASWLSSSVPPPGRAGSLALISSLDPAIDGTYQLTSDPLFVSGSTNKWAVTMNYVGTATPASDFPASSIPPRSISILSLANDPNVIPTSTYEMFLFDSSGTRVRPDKVVPDACDYLK